jgi:hypothetical protein
LPAAARRLGDNHGPGVHARVNAAVVLALSIALVLVRRLAGLGRA